MSWEAFLAQHFPGYLLPEAFRRALPEDAAARFLSRLGGGPRQLFLLRAASIAAAQAAPIRAFALDLLPALARHLPACADRERRVGHGELRGRLDVTATLRRQLAGRPLDLVGRSPRIRRGRPEDALAKAVAERLRDVLTALRDAGVLGRAGWGADLAPCADALARVLETTAIRDVPSTSIDASTLASARRSPHPAHAAAAALHLALAGGLDDPDPARIARVVAEGALAPLADHTRFELAVLLRLVQALAARRPHFVLRHTIVASGRGAVAELHGEGAVVRVHYDQACLAPGPYDTALRRYFGPRGRLRPDITVTVEAAGGARAVLVEAKLSADAAYLAQSFRDAVVYRVEHGAALEGWPKVVLVTEAPVASAPSREDDVIAVGWDRWVPDEVVEAMLEGV